MSSSAAEPLQHFLGSIDDFPQRKVVPLPQSTIGGPGDTHRLHPNTRDPRGMPPLKTGGFGWGLEFGVWPFP